MFKKEGWERWKRLSSDGRCLLFALARLVVSNGDEGFGALYPEVQKFSGLDDSDMQHAIIDLCDLDIILVENHDEDPPLEKIRLLFHPRARDIELLEGFKPKTSPPIPVDSPRGNF